MLFFFVKFVILVVHTFLKLNLRTVKNVLILLSGTKVIFTGASHQRQLHTRLLHPSLRPFSLLKLPLEDLALADLVGRAPLPYV